jgi:hypothetical protein
MHLVLDDLQKKWKTTSKKMKKIEEDLKKNENGRQPHFLLLKN